MNAEDAKQELKQALREHFEVHTDALVEVLKQLIEHDYPPEVAMLYFEIFPDQGVEMFPVRVFFLDEDNAEYFLYEDGKAKYPSPVDPGLLETGSVYPSSLIDKYDALEDAGELDIFEIIDETVTEWFDDCWQAAGGMSFPRKAQIESHDGHMMYDLKARAWFPA